MTVRSDISPGWWPKDGHNRAPARGLTPLAILLIIAAGLAVYSPSFDGEFLMDDQTLIVDNPLVKSWIHAAKLFTVDIGAGSGIPFAYFRPLQMLSYLINYHFWQLDARAYHAVNIILHLLTALSLFWLAGLLTRDRMLSLATALLFVVHPVQAEAVAYISGRGDCLVGLFVLLTAACYVKYLENGRWSFYGLALLCLVAALLSKENGMVLPGLLVLCQVHYRKSLKSPALIGTVVVLLAYLVWYIAVMENVAGGMGISELPNRIPGVFAAIAGYLRILIFPFHLYMGHDFRLFEFTDPPVIIGLVLTGLMILVAVLSIRRQPLLFLAIAWFFITLLPVSNFFPSSFYMADHFLYLPSMGFFLATAYLLTGLYHLSGRYRKTALVAFAAVVLFYAVLGLRQNDYWLTRKGFYERTLRYAPDSARMLNNVGTLYDSEGDYDRAETLYKRAISIKADMLIAHYNLGVIYKVTGRLDESIEVFKRVLAIDPDFSPAHNMLGVVYSKTGQWDQAEAAYRKAIVANAADAVAVNNLAVVYYHRGDLPRAVELFHQTIRIDPTYALAFKNLGHLYRQAGDLQKADIFFKKAADLQDDQLIKMD